MALKHVGRVKQTKKKVIVAYRVVPKEPESCIVVLTESLMADEHDALIKAVESDAGQTAYEFAEAMARSVLPDGRNMLAGFHTTGRMMKVPTASIEMTPDSKSVVSLDELNRIIAEKKGVSIEDLALKSGAEAKREVVLEETDLDVPVETVEAAQVASEQILTDDELAAKYRSDADRLYKEAKRLREEAEKLSPTKRKTKTAESA